MKISKNNGCTFAIRTVFRKCIACFSHRLIKCSLWLTVHHRGESMAGGVEVARHVVCTSRKHCAERKWGAIKPQALPPVTDFLQQAPTSPSFQSFTCSTPAGDQVSDTWSYRRHATFKPLTGGTKCMTHILGSFLYPTPFLNPFSLSPFCFFWFSIWFQNHRKEFKAMTNLKSTPNAKPYLASWSTNSDGKVLSACFITATLI